MDSKTQYNNYIKGYKEHRKCSNTKQFMHPETTTPISIQNFDELPSVIRHILVGEKGNIIQQEIQPEMVFSYGLTNDLRARDIIDGLKYILKNYKDMTYPSNYKAWTTDQLKLAIKHWRDPSSAVRCWLGVEE